MQERSTYKRKVHYGKHGNCFTQKISFNKLHLLRSFSHPGKFSSSHINAHSFLLLLSGLQPFICESENNDLSSAFTVTHI